MSKEYGPHRADVWVDGLSACMKSLQSFPARFGLAAESSELKFEVRQLLYGDKKHAYRILFRILKDDFQSTVLVLHVRHSARDKLRQRDLKN